MVCLGNICINTLHKGAKDDDDDDDDDNNNNNNIVIAAVSIFYFFESFKIYLQNLKVISYICGHNLPGSYRRHIYSC
jgi:hypothetical protein